MFQSNNKNNSLSSIIAPEMEIKGDIDVVGDIIIYGKIFGNIKATGSINTAKGSLVNGDIHANNAYLSGEINGNIHIDKKVVLSQGSILVGNLQSSIITIEEGASFEGMSQMLHVKEKSNVKKMLSLNS